MGFNGTQGPQGIQGPIGPNGTQGPPGITNVNASNYYSVIGNASIITNIRANSTALCLPGDVAISGEYDLTDVFPSVSPLFMIVHFGSLGPDPPTNWSTQLFGVEGQTVTTTVNCYDNPPLRP